MAAYPPAAPGTPRQANLYNTIKDKPLHVDVILLQKGRTQPYLIEKELQRIFDAQTLDELKEKLLEAQAALEALDIFEAVQLVIDQSTHVSS